MKNSQIAEILTKIVKLLEIKSTNPFRLRAYRIAIEVIESLPFSLEQFVAQEGKLTEIDGIGKAVSEKIIEILETGSCGTLRDLLAVYPEGLLDMLRISGMGPKKVRLVFTDLGIDNVDELERCARAGGLRGLPRMGPKTEEKILRAIGEYKSLTRRLTLSTAIPHASTVIKALETIPGVLRLQYAGSLRRWCETIGNIDIVATCTSPKRDYEDILGKLKKSLPDAQEITSGDPGTITLTLDSSTSVKVYLSTQEDYGATLLYYTGSKAHNAALSERARSMGLSIDKGGVYSRDGTRLACPSEEEIYKAMGLQWIAPELRSDTGEIEASIKGKLPEQLSLENIKGDLHMHTLESDGSATVADMAYEAIRRGYEYIAITDHSSSTSVANGLDNNRLLKHIDIIDKFNQSLMERGIKFTVLKGSEVDIRRDGSLDYPAETLKRLDIVVASIHSGFAQEKAVMTARIIRAIETGLVNIVAHPTGRLIGVRAPFDFDIEEVFRAAKQHRTSMELNCYPERLDLKVSHLKLAKKTGLLIALSTDAHSPSTMGNIEYGIHMARRAWLEAKDVLNTRSLEQLKEIL